MQTAKNQKIILNTIPEKVISQITSQNSARYDEILKS